MNSSTLTRNTPKYQTLMNELAKQIRENAFAPTQKLPPERELMRTYCTSYATISRAMKELEQAGFVERIWGKGTFAKRPEQNRVGQIAIAFSSVYRATHPFMTKVLSGIEASVTEHDWHMQLFPVRESKLFNDEAPTLLSKLLDEKHIDGLIICSAFQPQEIRRAQAMGIPVVSVNMEYPGMALSAVMENSKDCAYQTIEHLAQNGHKRVGLVMGPIADSSARLIRASKLMYDSLLDQLKSHDMICDSKFILSTDYTWESCASHLKQWLQSPECPTALIFRDDFQADKTRRLAEELNMQVPKDISIISIGDILTDSQLTSIHVPLEEMGQKAAELIINYTAKMNMGGEIISLSGKLIDRGTVAKITK